MGWLGGWVGWLAGGKPSLFFLVYVPTNQTYIRPNPTAALAAEVERRKARDGAPKSLGGWLRLCYGSYRHVQKEFFGAGGDVAAVARARLRVERLAAGKEEVEGEVGGELRKRRGW